jgi:hypothetical protein
MMKKIFIAGLVAAAACTKQEGNADTAQIASAQPSAVSATPRDGAKATSSASLVTSRTIKVYKDANCGCCKEWIEHLKQNGFTVEAMDMPDLSAVKAKYGVRQELQACHTAVIDNYVVEGHVPADLIVKMLEEKPAIAGIAVPGMPMGSPGMEGATRQPYDVLTFDSAGRTTVYAKR